MLMEYFCKIYPYDEIGICVTQLPHNGGASTLAYNLHEYFQKKNKTTKLFLFLNKKELQNASQNIYIANPKKLNNVFIIPTFNKNLVNLFKFSFGIVGKYLIIAEDDEDDRFLMRSAFIEAGNSIELVFVSDGLELVNHFRKIDNGELKDLPSLLIVDLNMPKKNGREAISEINERSYFNTFPTVIFSTSDNQVEREKCKLLGIHNFYVKPPSYNKLLEMVTEFKNLAGI